MIPGLETANLIARMGKERQAKERHNEIMPGGKARRSQKPHPKSSRENQPIQRKVAYTWAYDLKPSPREFWLTMCVCLEPWFARVWKHKERDTVYYGKRKKRAPCQENAPGEHRA